MKNVLVTGANGQLGSEIYKIKNTISKINFIFKDVNNLDITDFNGIKSFFKENKIDFIINCAAYTAVDKAEKEHKTARLINVYGVSNLAEMSEKYNIPIIHISTDYVYSGETNRPMNEEFPENPQSIYGKTKFDGDEILIATTKNFVILRISWLYSSFGSNFVKTMIKHGKEKDSLNVVYDQIGSPTYAGDLAEVIVHILQYFLDNEKIIPGIFHYSNEGTCSWYDFAKEIMNLYQLDCKIEPILTKEYPTPAFRPPYSVLDKEKIKKTYKIKIPYWKESLQKCINQIKEQ